MSLMLVTGSTDGIGARIADLLAKQGHEVIRHARDGHRAADCRAATGAEVVIGDLADLAATRAMAQSPARRGRFDVVVHNAGWAPRGPVRPVTADGLEQTFQVNALSAMTTIAFAVARRYPGVPCNAVHPGWVRTKMSGDEAPLDVDAGADTPVADTADIQDALVERCATLTSARLRSAP